MPLNAENYGVPQRRNRLFVIAVRADVGRMVGIESDTDVLLLFPAPTHAPIAPKSAWDGLEQSDWELHPFRRAMMTSNLGHLARRIRHDRNRWMTPRKAGLGTYRYTTVRRGIGLPSPTVTASGQQPDGRSGIIHPFDHRKVSLREMMRSSGFADDLVLTGTVGRAATRIGMSVPPLMTKAIADGGPCRWLWSSVDINMLRAFSTDSLLQVNNAGR
jgi:DNA (cytosine-5)-methyltransferase 1